MNGAMWRLGAAALIVLLSMVGSGTVAWKWQANHYGKQLAEQAAAYGRDREQAAVAVIDWQERQQIERRALEDRLQANDQTHVKELRDAQTYQARLRDRLATADVRLSVLLAAAPGGGGGVPTSAGAGSVVHAARRVQLDPAHAQRIIGITDAGDQGLIALRACQAYVEAINQGWSQ